MWARVETDHRLTSTTEARIAWLIGEAARLRDAYRVPSGFQHAPFFQVQTERFALVAIDTSVLRRVDPDQWAWLRSALERARGKFIMVVLGHPLYTGGHYQAEADEEFATLHRLLREHEVPIVMAGDTHDLELYVERYPTAGGERVMHHVVNGGGGAYLSFGTAHAEPMTLPDGRLPALVSSSRTPTTLRLRRVPISTTSLGHQNHPSSPSRALDTTSAGARSGFVALVIARSPLTARDQFP